MLGNRYNINGAKPDFKTDLNYGISGQAVIANYLRGEGILSGVNQTAGKFIEYDIFGWDKSGIRQTTEVKTQRADTGNIFIEIQKQTSCGVATSGLNVTTANRWVEFNPATQKSYWCEPKELRDWLAVNDGVHPRLKRKTKCGDWGSVEGYILPWADFEALPFVKVRQIPLKYYGES